MVTEASRGMPQRRADMEKKGCRGVAGEKLAGGG